MWRVASPGTAHRRVGCGQSRPARLAQRRAGPRATRNRVLLSALGGGLGAVHFRPRAANRSTSFRRLTKRAANRFCQRPEFAGPRSVGERPVKLFARRRTHTTAPGIPTPRDPAPLGSGPVACTPTVALPTVSAPTTPAEVPPEQRPAAPDPEAGAAAGRPGVGSALAATDAQYALVLSGSGDGLPAATVEGTAAASSATGGWMLLALHGQRRHWSTPLLSRGAAFTAPPRVAQAVAVRVLTDLGLQVRAWHNVSGADQPMYRAQLEA